MSQRHGGVYSLLSMPAVYRAYHHLIGHGTMRQAVIDELRPAPGNRLLDIGCGPADMLEYLPDIEYVGFDVNPKYIEHARRRYGDRGTFFVADAADVDAKALGTFDLVLSHGVLHHLDDKGARDVLSLASQTVSPTGRLVTNDSAHTDDQSRLARLFVSLDRGTSVRTPEAYRALADEFFREVDVHVHHSLLRIPYTCVVLTCTAPRVDSAPVPHAADGSQSP